MRKSFVLIAGLVGILALASPAHAAIVDSGTISIIDSTEIIAFPDPVPTGSGLGTLDLNMLQQGSGGAGNNPSGPLNFDNANTQMPNGAPEPTANESYITSIGDLRQFYVLNFPDTTTADLNDSTVNQIVLFYNSHETGTPQDIKLDELSIVQDFTVPALNPATSDITSTQQNAINDSWKTGDGTVIAKLNTSISPYSMPQVNAGIGQPDYFILSGIDPFDPIYSDSTELLFYWKSHDHNAGGEVVYLSGTYNAQDLCEATGNCPDDNPGNPIPEPSSMLLVGTGLAGLIASRLRKKAA